MINNAKINSIQEILVGILKSTFSADGISVYQIMPSGAKMPYIKVSFDEVANGDNQSGVNAIINTSIRIVLESKSSLDITRIFDKIDNIILPSLKNNNPLIISTVDSSGYKYKMIKNNSIIEGFCQLKIDLY